MNPTQRLTAILPCNNLDASEAFYRKLGFIHRDGPDEYRMLSDGHGGELHLNQAVEGWLIPGRNPFGLYLYVEDVDGLAAGLTGLLHPPKDLSLIHISEPTRLL